MSTQNILITGASPGLGAGMARAFAAKGRNLALCARRVERLQKQYLETARLGKALTIRVSLDVLAISESELLDEVVTFDSDLFSPANGTYRVVSVGFADNYASVELALMQYDGDIERDWIPADDERAFTIADLDVT